MNTLFPPLRVIVQNRHFKKAKNYIVNCPLELALKEFLPGSGVYVGSEDVSISKDGEFSNYKINNTEWNIEFIERTINAAKKGFNTPDVEVILSFIGKRNIN